MNNLQLNTFSNDNDNTDNIVFSKKQKLITFAEFFHSQKLDNSPYLKKNYLKKFSYFQKMQNFFKTNFSKLDKSYYEKKEINALVKDLIRFHNFNDLNELFKHGLTLNKELNIFLLKEIKENDLYSSLFSFQTKQPLFGALAESLFLSSYFQIYGFEILEKLSLHFPQEKLPVSMLDDFEKSNACYQTIPLKDLSYNKDYLRACIHFHNLFLDSKISFNLFSYALNKFFSNNKKYEFYSPVDSAYPSLKILYPYIKNFLSQNDLFFLQKEFKKELDKAAKKQNARSLRHDLHSMYEQISNDINPQEMIENKKELLQKVKTLYSSEISIVCNLLPLKVEIDDFLPSHREIIEKIKNIHKKLLQNQTILDEDYIEKGNKIISETLPLTLEKYNQIDPNFRATIKNVEGKNAQELLTESLNNILLSFQELEIHLEQEKVNELSVVNRKNKIKN